MVRILRVEVLPTNCKSEDVVWPGVEIFSESTIYTCEGGGYFSFKVGVYPAHIHVKMGNVMTLISNSRSYCELLGSTSINTVNNLQCSNLNLKDFILIKL